MAILDVFSLLYKADTKQAEKSIEDLEKKAEKPGKKIKQSGSDFASASKEMVGGLKSVADQAGATESAIGQLATKLSSLGGGPLTMIAGSIVAATAVGVASAMKAADDARNIRKLAFDSKTDEASILRNQVVGTRLGLNRGDATENAASMMKKQQELAFIKQNPYLASISDRRMAEMNKASVTGPGGVASLSRYVDTSIRAVRVMAEREGKEKAMVYATRIYGMTQDFARKAINASNEEIKHLKDNLAAETGQRMLLQGASIDLANAQDKLKNKTSAMGDSIAKEVVPAVNRLIDAFTKDSGGGSIATIIGQVASKIVDLGTNLVTFFGQLVEIGGKAKTAISDRFTDEQMQMKIGQDAIAAVRAKRGPSLIPVTMLDSEVKSTIQESYNKLAGQGVSRDLFTRQFDKNNPLYAEAKRRAGQNASNYDVANMGFELAKKGNGSFQAAQAASEAAKKGVQDLVNSDAFKNDITSVAGKNGVNFSGKEYSQAVKTMLEQNPNISQDKVRETLLGILEEQRKTNVMATKQTKLQSDLVAAMVPMSIEQMNMAWAGNMSMAADVKAAEGHKGYTRAVLEAKARQVRDMSSPFVNVSKLREANDTANSVSKANQNAKSKMEFDGKVKVEVTSNQPISKSGEYAIADSISHIAMNHSPANKS